MANAVARDIHFQSINCADNVLSRIQDNIGRAFDAVGLALADYVKAVDLLALTASKLMVTATGAVNAAVTCTLPAPASGLRHYITKIELTKLYNVVGVAAGAGVIVTTTNLPGSPSYTTEQLASAAGTVVKVIDETYAGNPLAALAAATATTFVAPAQLQTIWRWNVSYFTAA